MKDELSSLKQERRKYFKKKLVNHEEASESNNNAVKTIESGLGLATTDQPPLHALGHHHYFLVLNQHKHLLELHHLVPTQLQWTHLHLHQPQL